MVGRVLNWHPGGVDRGGGSLEEPLGETGRRIFPAFADRNGSELGERRNAVKKREALSIHSRLTA